MKNCYVSVSIGYDILDFSWDYEHIGFGHVITNWNMEIIDDENMSKEFCQDVIEKGLKRIRQFLDKNGGELPYGI